VAALNRSAMKNPFQTSIFGYWPSSSTNWRAVELIQ
jgi:hypothetical protein